MLFFNLIYIFHNLHFHCLGQQEEEYEDELRQLIAAAESELVSERETITKLRTLVQMKNTKVDQLKKKLVELSNIFKARQVR